MATLKDKEIGLTALLKIQTPVNTYTFTALDIPIIFNSETYTPRGFEINDVSQTVVNQVSHLSITVDNVDNFFDNVIATEDIRGSKVEIWLVALDSNFKPTDFLLMFSGYLNKYNNTKENVEFEFLDDLAFWNKTTFRQHTYDLFPSIQDVEEKPLLWGTTQSRG